jgi:hypothetical protein
MKKESLTAVSLAATVVLGGVNISSESPQASTDPVFSGEIHEITEEQVQRNSWGLDKGEKCPVSAEDLRLLKVDHWGFDDKPHKGELIVNKSESKKVLGVMHTLFDARFPIEKMKLIEEYAGNDFNSIEDNNTSAFNCRYVENTKRLSKHASGLAIDINPIQNPYVETKNGESKVSHTESWQYIDRSQKRKGMIHAGDIVATSFANIGWKNWGGNPDWTPDKDYQHIDKR